MRLNEETELKRCPRCEEHKPPSEFYNQASRPDGLRLYCKPCANARLRDWQSRRGSVGDRTSAAESRDELR